MACLALTHLLLVSLAIGTVASECPVTGDRSDCPYEGDHSQLLQVTTQQRMFPGAGAAQTIPLPPMTDPNGMLGSDWVPYAKNPPLVPILCPMICLGRPRTTSREVMLSDMAKFGYDPNQGRNAAIVTLQQQRQDLYNTTDAAEESGEAPYIYDLNAAAWVSQPTDSLFIAHLSSLKLAVQQCMDANGNSSISYMQTIDLKLYVLRLAGVTNIDVPTTGAEKPGASFAQTLQGRMAQTFIRAGGDFDSGYVDADDWVRLLTCQVPYATGFNVGPDDLGWISSAKIGEVREKWETTDAWNYSRYPKAVPPCSKC